MKKKIVFITTASFTVRFYLYPHIKALSKIYDVTIVADGDPSYFEDIISENVHFYPIEIRRKIDFYTDFKALFALYRLFKSANFVCAHSIMPKSGLLGMAVAYFTGIKVRIHTFTGQPWVTMKPPFKWILMFMDKLVGYFATTTMADSSSQLEFLLSRKIISEKKSKVLGAGSICGVDTVRFCSNLGPRMELRSKIGVSDDNIVFMYLGRLTKEKGLIELAFAFKEVLKSCPAARLVYVGPEEDEIVKETCLVLGADMQHFSYFPYTRTPEIYYNIADIYCLPSEREGFGSAILEAAAFGIPSIGTDIYGISDAIVDGETGLLIKPKARDQLIAAMIRLSNDNIYRKNLGHQALLRTHEEFSESIVTGNLVNLYEKVLDVV